MKILAMEKEIVGSRTEQLSQQLILEAKQVWKLYQEGFIREFYFRQDQSKAVLILECTNREEALRVLDSLPLVQQGLIAFDLIPLIPYPGFSRLFVQN